MDRGSIKKSFFEYIKGPNENRFVAANLNPKVSSKYPHHECPDFGRYMARDVNENDLRKKPSPIRNPMPDYNPNKEAT